jgi:hypothetical protein
MIIPEMIFFLSFRLRLYIAIDNRFITGVAYERKLGNVSATCAKPNQQNEICQITRNAEKKLLNLRSRRDND